MLPISEQLKIPYRPPARACPDAISTAFTISELRALLASAFLAVLSHGCSVTIGTPPRKIVYQGPPGSTIMVRCPDFDPSRVQKITSDVLPDGSPTVTCEQ